MNLLYGKTAGHCSAVFSRVRRRGIKLSNDDRCEAKKGQGMKSLVRGLGMKSPTYPTREAPISKNLRGTGGRKSQALLAIPHAPPRSMRPLDALGSGALHPSGLPYPFLKRRGGIRALEHLRFVLDARVRRSRSCAFALRNRSCISDLLLLDQLFSQARF